MTAYTDIAWSRQLAGTSRGQIAGWALAGIVIFSAHASAAWWVMRVPSEQLAQIAGSAAIKVDLAALGFSSADQVTAGEKAETIEPVETQTVEPVPIQATPVEPVTPLEQAPPTQPTKIEPQQAVTAETADSPVSRLAEAVSEVQIAALLPVENEARIEPEAALPVEAKTLEPLEEQDIAALIRAPLPTPRPDYTPQRTEKPKQERPRQKVRKKTASGAQGQNKANAIKGTSQGSQKGRAAKQSTGSQGNSQAGNAAASNYSGQIQRKLQRAIRSVSGRGQVIVNFTVNKSGGLAGVRITRGSGSARLDRAAIDTVRRAAPFPPIPVETGRSSWNFTLPITFKR